jgi:hypothetical protein
MTQKAIPAETDTQISHWAREGDVDYDKQKTQLTGK